MEKLPYMQLIGGFVQQHIKLLTFKNEIQNPLFFCMVCKAFQYLGTAYLQPCAILPLQPKWTFTNHIALCLNLFPILLHHCSVITLCEAFPKHSGLGAPISPIPILGYLGYYKYLFTYLPPLLDSKPCEPRNVLFCVLPGPNTMCNKQKVLKKVCEMNEWPSIWMKNLLKKQK